MVAAPPPDFNSASRDRRRRRPRSRRPVGGRRPLRSGRWAGVGRRRRRGAAGLLRHHTRRVPPGGRRGRRRRPPPRSWATPSPSKPSGDRWRHRTDQMGVRLDVVTQPGARRAYTALTAAVRARRVEVQRMAPKGHRVRAGDRRRPLVRLTDRVRARGHGHRAARRPCVPGGPGVRRRRRGPGPRAEGRAAPRRLPGRRATDLAAHGGPRAAGREARRGSATRCARSPLDPVLATPDRCVGGRRPRSGRRTTPVATTRGPRRCASRRRPASLSSERSRSSCDTSGKSFSNCGSFTPVHSEVSVTLVRPSACAGPRCRCAR